MQTGRRMFLAVLVLVIVTRVNCEFDDDTLQKLRNILRKESRAFLDETAKVNQMREFNNLRKVTAVSSTPPSESSDSIKTNRTDKWSRWKRSGCPGGVGNFGFNSFNLLTFSLQAFNGVINTINNLNNNNNNNNINSGNNANSNFNEQNSNVNSMSMLVVIVPPPRRRKRELWEKENGHCEQDMSEQEIQTVIQDTYSTISDIIKMSQHNPNCGKYILCLNIQNSYARYGLQVLSEMSRQKKLWNDIIEPMLTAGHCSSLFPECFWA
ncbi:GATA zinc finger domain-containing protein 8-like [Homarus americanus]|nr:GATA zinc finger domain-containing protein 8-like [Homarus americanus]